MNVVKTSCTDETAAQCYDSLKLTNPNMVSLVHFPNNHIVIDKLDYDDKGHVKKTAWKKTEEDKLDLITKNKMRVIYEKEFV
jgi:hypothetical protein